MKINIFSFLYLLNFYFFILRFCIYNVHTIYVIVGFLAACTNKAGQPKIANKDIEINPDFYNRNPRYCG